ncbi:hypothetical protein H310_04717 [Aphanomyces invadans]|uniref:3'(2'),5'-bisphosphate nucleotidase n=1 Tax=Aphanomyces invadans TaxID=157072 RepID=A0A024UDX0_9STRA|nr:hypothetical protein H310_04717 [Aphanomyces invadans]ETW04444.1 hypothetical protein H310_04717 [Aphanomyces invadans]|eukprot:XP_008867400.1 hypothetical protein H310_04717 [Aphanomyces invadans]
MSSSSVDLIALLSACVDLGAFAGQVIRDVVASGESLQTVNKADDGATASFDPQTIADTRAQQRIVESLRRHFGPKLIIVGEEGHLDPPAGEDVTTPCTSLLAATHPTAVPVDLEDLVVWIDPLDGTRKFTEKAYDDVSVLLGLSYRGRPIAGVMHQPFVGGGGGTTYYGGPAVDGIFRCHVVSPYTTHMFTWPAFERVPTGRATLSTRSTPIVGHSESPCGHANAILPLLNMSTMAKGSTGILLLDVALGHIDVYFRYIHRTKRWDSCVGEAFLIVLGGVLTDRNGHLYDYSASGDHENTAGIVASLDKSLHATVVACVATYAS